MTKLATTRVQLDLPPNAMARLKSLKARSEASSYAEVIRVALMIYERRLNALPVKVEGPSNDPA